MALLSMWTCEHTERSVENVYELYGRHWNRIRTHTYIHARGYTRSTYYTLVLSLAHTNTHVNTEKNHWECTWKFDTKQYDQYVMVTVMGDISWTAGFFRIWHAVRHMHRWLDLVSIVSIMVGMLPFAGPSLEFHSHISTHVCVSMCLNRSRVQMYEETI